MGTNYYLHEKHACKSCGRDYPSIHIGKSSGGWCFALHVDEQDGLRDLPDWIERWSSPTSYIRDEYGSSVAKGEMLAIITKRTWAPARRWSAEEMERNHAVPGPNGLVRHGIDVRHCIKHGEGTWDCCPGEFS